MLIRAVAFTDQGRKLLQHLQENMLGESLVVRNTEPLASWVEDAFAMSCPIIFVGATGIAVRTIAPFVKDKLTDSPVLVLDEKGEYVIPLLSGHMGGANLLARRIEEAIGAKAVITTATDVERTFAVDVFARKNGFAIKNREGIQKVSSKLLKGEQVKISVHPFIAFEKAALPKSLLLEEYPPKETVDILIEDNEESELDAGITLYPKRMILGIGCKKGKSFEDIDAFVEGLVDEEFVNMAYALASIDLKKEEAGLLEFASRHHLPFLTYTSDELLQVEGDFSDSEFVKQTTGVANVCERAALCCAGEGGKIIMRKQAYNGMTFALAMRVAKIETWEMDYE